MQRGVAEDLKQFCLHKDGEIGVLLDTGQHKNLKSKNRYCLAVCYCERLCRAYRMKAKSVSWLLVACKTIGVFGGDMGHFSAQATQFLALPGRDPDRRVNIALAMVVNHGFELHFRAGYQASTIYLRAHGVPAAVIVRLINYDRRRR